MNVWWTVEMESWLTQTNESSHRCHDLSKLWANLDNTSGLQLCTSIDKGRGSSTYLHLEGRTANFKDGVLARSDIYFLLTVKFHKILLIFQASICSSRLSCGFYSLISAKTGHSYFIFHEIFYIELPPLWPHIVENHLHTSLDFDQLFKVTLLQCDCCNVAHL